MGTLDDRRDDADLVVVGAGIVGLAHAHAAVERGLSVVVVERADHATGASVRNFGLACATAQTGRALAYGLAARPTWLRLAEEAGLWLRPSGTVLVARAADELAVLTEFCELRGPQEARLLSAQELAAEVPLRSDVVGGALLPGDLRLDPRAALPAIARHLERRGVRFLWSTTAHAIETGVVHTSRGPLRARGVVVATDRDLGRHYPELATKSGLRRCALRMLRVDNPLDGATIDPAVQTGFSMIRYSGFAACPSLPALRERLTRDHPELVAHGLNLMFAQRPDGSLVIGDTHSYANTLDPFEPEELDAAVLAESARLLGVPRLTVRERWRGVYGSAPEPFLVETPTEGVRVVAVTAGLGMTTAFGLAPEVLDGLLGTATAVEPLAG